MPPSTSHHAWRILHVIVLVVCSSGARSVVCFLFLCSSDQCESGRHWRKGHRCVWSLFWWNCYALFCVRVFPICCCVYQLLFPCEGWFRVQLPYNRARIFNNRSYFFPFFRRAKLKKLTMKHFIDLMILLPSRNLCFSHILENRFIIKTFLAVLLHTLLYYFHFPSLHFHSTEFLIADFLWFILFCLRSFSFSHLAVYHGYYKMMTRVWGHMTPQPHHSFFSPWENFQGKLSSNSCFV